MDKRKSFFDYTWYNFDQMKMNDIWIWEREIKEDKNMLIDMAFGC